VKQSHVSRPETSCALEGNRVAFFSRMARGPGGALDQTATGVRMSSGVPFSLFNGVLRTNCSESEVEKHIASTITHFRNLGLPFHWAIGPGDQPPQLREKLLAAGFAEHWSPAMAVNLNEVPEAPAPDELIIRPVRTAEEVRLFAQTLNAGDFRAPVEIERAIPDMLAPFSRPAGEEADLRCFVGYRDGVPVATSARYLHDGVVGIYGVATVSSARRRGFGAAMTVAALQDGRSLGYGVGVLIATSMGEPVYQRLGFRELYRVGEFHLPPATAPS